MRKAVAFLLLVMLGCRHDALFRPRDYTAAPGFGSGAFHRVTYGAGSDLFPSWLPVGTGVIYAFEPSDDRFHDRCLASILPEGGTRRALPCLHHRAPDSVMHSNWPAAAADGRLAFVGEHLPPGAFAVPDSAIIFVTDPTAPGVFQAVFRLPFVVPGVHFYHTATHLGWLSRDTLVAVGTAATIVRDCTSCPYRPVRLGQDVVLIDLGTSPATLTVVPGTFPASGVAAGPSGNDVYYTLAGDARVFHRVLTTGDSAVVHDFGAAGIARDARLLGTRLVAVVGGGVSYRVDPVAGPVQDDSGGFLHVVDLQTGAESVLPDSGYRYQHPALAPAGDAVMAEGLRDGPADLWYFRIPQ